MSLGSRPIYHVEQSQGYIWDTNTLSWIPATASTGGGGGGAVTVADGADVTQGNTSDAAVTTNTTGTISGKLRGLVAILASVWDSGNSRLNVAIQNTPSVSVSNSVGVTGPLTDAQLRAVAVPVSLTTVPSHNVTNAGTFAVQATVTPTSRSGSTPTAATVGVASGQAVASNASRKGLVLTNVSTNRISFGVGQTAVLDSGITLYPGGVWAMDEYTFSTGAINAIASAASSPLAIQEFT